ncbi:MAG: DUF692 domain-containing protein, partial [Proteobacteria bacterium]|nr:DUF692 domain-containing protein [Pseudomonadota bacterium]
HDSHHEPIQNDLLDLCQAVMEYAPVKAIIIERDGNFPEPQELADELRTIKAFCNGH